MRDSLKTANLGELMGEGYEHRTKLTLADLPKLIGHKMPEITYDMPGRVRLHNALQTRFGTDYMNIPHIKDLLDQHADMMKTHAQIKMNRQSQKLKGV